MTVWSHKEWEELEILIHGNIDDLALHLKAVRRLVAEEKYRALVEDQGRARAKKSFWSFFAPF